MSRKKFCEFPASVRERIKQRDKGCIFCQQFGPSGFDATQIMHYIGRGQSGLGIEQNGAWGCVVHHQELDNGTNSAPLREYFKEYLMSQYPGWNEADLKYDKWKFLKGD